MTRNRPVSPAPAMSTTRSNSAAARGIGARDRRIIGRHILPNIAGPLVVLASFGMADAMITEAGLSVHAIDRKADGHAFWHIK